MEDNQIILNSPACQMASEQFEESERQQWIADVEAQERRDALGTKYVICTMRDFIRRDLPSRDFLLYPFIQEKGLSMLYAKRGVGKTYVGLAMALAVSSGNSIMRFRSEGRNKVLYIDGEMPAQTIQDRLKKLSAGFGGISEEWSDNLQIFTPDLQDDPMPNIAIEDGQKEIDKLLVDGVKLVIIDNLSALCNFGRENEAESWRAMQKWLLALRRRGISVLLIDHAGKNGDNRGTSKKQDILDSVICLKQPDGYKQAEGARFVIQYEKSRSICGKDIEGYEVKLCEMDNDSLVWQTAEVMPKNAEKRAAEQAKALELHQKGKGIREIGAEMGIGKTKAAELLKDARVSENAARITNPVGRTSSFVTESPEHPQEIDNNEHNGADEAAEYDENGINLEVLDDDCPF